MDSERSPHRERLQDRPRDDRGLPAAAAGGLVAASIAGGLFALLRATLGVRTIPERLLEWALLFVPPEQFEAALQRFGFEAKRYGLYTAIGGMLLLLAALGTLALWRRWTPSVLLTLGVGLWLFTMLVVMPLTDAGFFAVDLIDGTPAAVGGYLAVALAYSATLAGVARMFGPGRAGPRRDGRSVGVAPSRRAALLLAASAVAAFAGTFLAVQLGVGRRTTTRVVVLDPQEPVPSGGIEAAKPHPDLVSTVLPAPVEEPTPTPVVGTGPGPTPVVGAGPGPTPALPEPPQSRVLTRDQDGAVLPLSRPPGELVDYLTANDYFYIVTKNAGGDPSPRAADWYLRIDGDVERAVELDYAALRKLPAVELTKTLECISNFVDKCELAPFGCDLISTARWKGVPLGNILELTGGLKPGVTFLSTVSADEFTTALPIDVALDPDTLLVYEMNGQVLPREHGYPARILVPGRYGMKSAKWVVALRPLRREVIDWYGQRQWSKQGFVRTMTRIDVPTRGATLPPGEHRTAGIAYAGERGISQVEISADDGATWRIAELLDPLTARDAWVRWESRFTLAPGAELTLVSRATDGTGALQDEAFSLPQPDGSSGWHHTTVRATA
jgi:DMSO/TMAO reductase YedYZ molybdopterin-dependent catalytic subunit